MSSPAADEETPSTAPPPITCPICSAAKPPSAFPANARSGATKNGRYSRACRPCRLAYNREWRRKRNGDAVWIGMQRYIKRHCGGCVVPVEAIERVVCDVLECRTLDGRTRAPSEIHLRRIDDTRSFSTIDNCVAYYSRTTALVDKGLMVLSEEGKSRARELLKNTSRL